MASARGHHNFRLVIVVVIAGCGVACPATESSPFEHPVGSRIRDSLSEMAGSLAIGRVYHTATLLPGGKVLVANGSGQGGANLALAELYDPSINMWASAGTLSSSRYLPTATLLANGKVFVTGGSKGLAVPSTELYDPTTNSWTNTAPMADARIAHTATLLPNGKVLVVGGSNIVTEFIAAAELYDPATNSWTGAGAMASGRVLHSATMLSNGKVLVAGGRDTRNSPALSSALLYDVASNTWASAAPMAVGRAGSVDTVLLNGKVLVTGGSDNSVLASGELYDVTTNSWTSAGAMATARGSHSATLLPSGKVLVVAGAPTNSGFPPLKSVEIYDPVSNMWKGVAPLTTERWGHTATLLPSGKVLVAAGVNGASGSESAIKYLVSAELYDPTAGMICSAASDCASTHCVDGLCCNAACAGPCDACNIPGRLGQCANADAGAVGSPSCAPYLCGGASSCLTSCTVDANCATGSFCSSASCAPKKSPGASCVSANECASSQCIDGVCCDTACDGPCNACNLAGSAGACVNRSSGASGSPDCAPYVCAGIAVTCPVSCSADDNCAIGNTCLGNQCRTKTDAGVEADAGGGNGGGAGGGNEGAPPSKSGCGCSSSSAGSGAWLAALILCLGFSSRRGLKREAKCFQTPRG